NNIGIDTSVVSFTLVLSILTGILFSIGPALFQSNSDLRSALESGNRTTESRKAKILRSLFVGLQIALAVVLLCGALMLLQSLQNLQRVDLGFQVQNRYTFRVWLPRYRYSE